MSSDQEATQPESPEVEFKLYQEIPDTPIAEEPSGTPTQKPTAAPTAEQTSTSNNEQTTPKESGEATEPIVSKRPREEITENVQPWKHYCDKMESKLTKEMRSLRTLMLYISQEIDLADDDDDSEEYPNSDDEDEDSVE